MTDNELRDDVAKAIMLQIHKHQTSNAAASLSFQYADAFMEAREKARNWSAPVVKEPARNFIGAKS